MWNLGLNDKESEKESIAFQLLKRRKVTLFSTAPFRRKVTISRKNTNSEVRNVILLV